jgi:hypothetical protein
VCEEALQGGEGMNRAERLKMALRVGPMTSLEIIQIVGTVTPSKVVDELRKSGEFIMSRKRQGAKLNEYYLPKGAR